MATVQDEHSSNIVAKRDHTSVHPQQNFVVDVVAVGSLLAAGCM